MKVVSSMRNEDKILLEQYYKYIGFTSEKKQRHILNLLSYCKEFRDTAYPMKDSAVTKLQIVEFTAHKEKKDLINVNGSLSLVDGDRSEARTFDAYIVEEKGVATVFLDITRVCVKDEPKLIRTTDKITEDEQNVISVTTYAGLGSIERKSFSSEFPKNPSDDYLEREKIKQLSAL